PPGTPLFLLSFRFFSGTPPSQPDTPITGRKQLTVLHPQLRRAAFRQVAATGRDESQALVLR
ncbi:hypothetical protein KL864_27560, partial [Mycolicibacterium goodii]|uniref:hypothetical protein n=1 Tax=Mycolicibacterium goodii TaxID=134601 RepID=UPI001BDD9C08